MADHAPATYEMVEVKAEDIMAERTSIYDAFMKATTWGVGAVIGLLVLLAIFVV